MVVKIIMDDDNFKYDSVVNEVINKFKSRARFGKEKYGTDLDREDLTTSDWILHVQEELMDAILYLEKLKKQTKLIENDLSQACIEKRK
jgi:hypothetical protein